MAADGGGAEQARIGIFLRLRPVASPSGRVLSSAEEGWVEFNVPRDATQGCEGAAASVRPAGWSAVAAGGDVRAARLAGTSPQPDELCTPQANQQLTGELPFSV